MVQQSVIGGFKRVFPGDTVLNWFLGAILLVFPAAIDGLLGRTPLLSVGVYRAVGIIFLAYAMWQTRIVMLRSIGVPGLIFAMLMAETPVVLLTFALVFLALPLKTGWRVFLWLGDAYMLALGAWYIFLARSLRRSAAAQIEF